MPNAKKALRSFFPWLAAAVLCLSLIAIGISFVAANVSKHTPQKRQEMALNISGAMPRDPLSDKVMSALAMVPTVKREEQLVAAMIENHQDARPHQKGLKEAAMVFELFVEGDITRFMAYFRADRLPERIEPIRSLRPHFVSIARAYKPLLLHAGGSAIAYDALKRYPDIQNHDAIRYDGETYERDPNGVPPHNLFIRKAPLLSVLETSDVPFVPLPLFESGSSEPKEKVTKINVDYGSPDHDVTYVYKPLSGVYVRSIAGAAKQAQPKTIAILETTVDGINQKGYIPWTQTFGEGKMFLFTKGKVYGGRWKREKGERFEFLDAEGNALPVSGGQVWVQMIETMNRVKGE